MTTKSIPDMLAELPQRKDVYPRFMYGNEVCLTETDHEEAMNVVESKVAVLKAAAEKRQDAGHDYICESIHEAGAPCTCGYDDLRKVLEKLK